jgi:hypothetical protein
LEDRAIVHERVIFAVFSAGIDPGRLVAKQIGVNATRSTPASRYLANLRPISSSNWELVVASDFANS